MKGKKRRKEKKNRSKKLKENKNKDLNSGCTTRNSYLSVPLGCVIIYLYFVLYLYFIYL